MKLLAVVVFAAGLAAAQTPAAPKEEVPNLQWVSLFNGHDLTGWDPVGQETWEVVDGSIHGKTVTKHYGYLQTVKHFKDFQLSLRFKCVSDGNSGVFFHTAFTAGTVDVSQGLQFEIDPTLHRHTGGIYGDGRQWIVWPAAEFEQVVHPHDWNDYLLKVEGNHYVARLNGIVVVDFTDPTPKSTDGTIALQMHEGGNGDVLFKDVFIRDLSRR